MPRFRTNPLDNEPDSKLTFDDVTTLVFVGMLALGVMFVMGLGVRCATHRIERVISAYHGSAMPAAALSVRGARIARAGEGWPGEAGRRLPG